MRSIILAIAIIIGALAQPHMASAAKLEAAIVAGGCFCCIEAGF